MYLYLRRRSERYKALMDENNALLDKFLKPCRSNPAAMSEAEAEEFFALGQEFFTLTKKVDIGLALTINEMLLERAKALGNTDGIIRGLYWTGLIMYQLESDRFSHDAESRFKEAAAFLDRYSEIENRETRMYLNRCLGNIYIIISMQRKVNHDPAEFFHAVDAALAFWNDPAVRAIDPDFPWDSFVKNAYQNTCSWMDQVRIAAEPIPGLIERIEYSFTNLIADTVIFKNETWPEVRSRYMQLSIDYHMGRITFGELFKELLDNIASTADDDYTPNGAFNILQLSDVIFGYLGNAPAAAAPEYQSARDYLFGRVIAYCRNAPGGEIRRSIGDAISRFGSACINDRESSRYLDIIVRFTTFLHLFTYVHSLMVERIMGILAQYFIDRRPELFVGIFGAETEEEVAEKRGEIIEVIRRAGLCHDIGKVSYYNTVALCLRRLYDFEFEIIKEHTNKGASLPDSGGVMGCVRAVALGHHKWYNGKGGYPDWFDNTASPYRFIIDVTSVADSIDAATDNVGRSYANAKTLAQVIDEIKDQQGTRYSPAVAAALDDPGLVARLEDAIKEGRKDAYFEAYSDLYGEE